MVRFRGARAVVPLLWCMLVVCAPTADANVPAVHDGEVVFKQPAEPRFKVALVLWGLTRTLRHTIKSIQTEITDVLLEADIGYDFFLHTYNYTHEYVNIRNHVHGYLDIEEYHLLDLPPERFAIEDQDPVQKALLHEYSDCMNVYCKTHHCDNLRTRWLLALHSKVSAMKLVEKAGLENYYAVMFLRPDVLFVQKLDLRWFDFENQRKYPNVGIVPAFHYNNGINDRWFLGLPEMARYYGHTFDGLHKICQEWLRKGTKFSSERFTKTWMQKHQPKSDIVWVYFPFKRIRLGGVVEKKDRNVKNDETCRQETGDAKCWNTARVHMVSNGYVT